MKKGLLLICASLLIVIFFGWFIFRKVVSTEEISKKGLNSSVASSEQTSFSYNCEQGKSVFGVLDEKAEVEYSESSFGKLVTAINNTKQGNNKYWLYSVDDKEATVGATEYICQGDEAIKWELM